MMERTWPRSTLKEISFRTSRFPNLFCRWLTLMMVSMVFSSSVVIVHPLLDPVEELRHGAVHDEVEDAGDEDRGGGKLTG